MQDTEGDANAMAEIPVALLDYCRPFLRTRAPAVRIVASTANGEPANGELYESLDPCRMSLAGEFWYASGENVHLDIVFYTH